MSNIQSTLKIALEHQKNGDIDASILCLKAAMEAGEDHELLLGMLASHYAEIGLRERAIPLYERVLLKNPQNHLARFQLGMLYYAADEYEQALLVWEETLKIKEEFVTKLYAAKAYISLGRRAEASPLLDEVINNAPSGHPIHTQAEHIRNPS